MKSYAYTGHNEISFSCSWLFRQLIRYVFGCYASRLMSSRTLLKGWSFTPFTNRANKAFGRTSIGSILTNCENERETVTSWIDENAFTLHHRTIHYNLNNELCIDLHHQSLHKVSHIVKFWLIIWCIFIWYTKKNGKELRKNNRHCLLPKGCRYLNYHLPLPANHII